MNVTIEKNSAVYGIINVNVVEADYADKVKKELRTIGAKRVIPGFRQGHAPMPTLVRMKCSMMWYMMLSSPISATTSCTCSVSPCLWKRKK